MSTVRLLCSLAIRHSRYLTFSCLKCYRFIKGPVNPTDGIRFRNSPVFVFGDSGKERQAQDLEVGFGFIVKNMKGESKNGEFELDHGKFRFLSPHGELSLGRFDYTP